MVTAAALSIAPDQPPTRTNIPAVNQITRLTAVSAGGAARIQDVLADPDWATALGPEDYRALTPLMWAHVAMHGEFKLTWPIGFCSARCPRDQDSRQVRVMSVVG